MDTTFNTDELIILRQSLEVITIQGKNAKQVADLQFKLESLIETANTPNSSADSKVKSK